MGGVSIGTSVTKPLAGLSGISSGGVSDPDSIGLSAADVGGGGFSPTDINGITLWLDADDATTITESAGEVSQWDDKSGNGFDVVQATGTSQPTTDSVTINSRNAIDFDGVNDFMSNSVDSTLFNLTDDDYTLFYVLDLRTPDQFECAVAWNKTTGNANNTIICYVNTTGILRTDIDFVLHDLSTSDLRNSTHLVDITAEYATTMVSRINGTQEASRSIAGSSGGAEIFAIGAEFDFGSAGNFITGSFGEVLLYNRVLDSSEQGQVETYLADRWGITLP